MAHSPAPSQTTTTPGQQRLDGTQRALAAGLLLCVTLVAFETTAVVTALPTITDDLDGLSLYGVTYAVYMLADLVALQWSSETADRYGVRRPFLVSVALFVIGLLIAASAPTMELVVLGRGLQGAGSGGFAPLTFITVQRAFPESRRASLFALLSAGWVLPTLIAPAISGVVTDHFGWRLVFLGIVPIALAVATVTSRAMVAVPPPDLAVERRASLLPNSARTAIGIAMVAFGAQFAQWWLAAGLCISGSAIAAKPLRSLLPKGFFRARSGLAAIMVVRFLSTAMFLGVDSFVPLAADRLHGARPIVQGFTIAGAAVLWSLGQAFAARRGTRLLPSRGAAIGFALMLIGAGATVPVIAPSWPLWATFISWSVAGFGMGIIFNPTTVSAMTYADDSREGEIGGQLHLADSLGFGCMSILGGATVAIADRTSFSLQGALGTNFSMALICGVIGLIVAHRVHARTT